LVIPSFNLDSLTFFQTDGQTNDNLIALLQPLRYLNHVRRSGSYPDLAIGCLAIRNDEDSLIAQ